MYRGTTLQLSLLTLWLALAIPGPAQTIPVDGYAAIVGGRVITGGDIKKFTRPLMERAQRSLSGAALLRAQQEIFESGLQRLVNEALVLEAFQASGGVIPESALRERVDSIIRERFDDNRAKLLETLRESGETEEAWLDGLRDTLTIQFMTQEMVNAKVSVSPLEIRTRYQETIDEYTSEELVNLQVITMRRPEDAAAAEAKRTQLEALREQLKDGADFGTLAKEHSEDEHAAKGGDFGWLRSSALLGVLREGIRGLEKGQVSGVIAGRDRDYLVKLLGIREGGARPISEVQDGIEETIRAEKQDARYNAWMEQLRNNHPIILFDPEELTASGD